MINPLIDLIKTWLQDDLAKVVPKAQWHGLPLEQVKNLKVPCVALYGGDVTFLPTRQDRSLERDSREFQQDFWIDLEGQSSTQIEQLTSLIVGLISLNQQTWLADFNQSPKDSPHHYSSLTIATRHRLRQIQIVGATPGYDEGKVRSRLQFRAIGQLEMTLLTPDLGTLLETVITTGKLGQAKNNSSTVDDTTQWETTVGKTTTKAGIARDGSVDSDEV